MKLPEFFGLDISLNCIKIAQIGGLDGGKYKIVALGHDDIGKNFLLLKDEQEKVQFAERIKRLRDNLNISTNKVVAALPESVIFSKILTVPVIPEEKLEQLLYFEAKNYLPVPVDSVQLDHIPINIKEIDGKKFQQILLIAAPKSFVNLYLEVLSKVNMELLALETESIASSRVFSLNKDLTQPIMIIDFGALTITTTIIKGKSIVFSQNINTGSNSLTQAIARDYNLNQSQAEQYKKMYGLTNQIGGKIFMSINPLMQIISNELNKIINYVNINLPEFIPQRYFIVGQGSLLPGLSEYFMRSLGKKIELIDPVASSFTYSDLVKSELTQNSGLGYVVSVGLALKES